MATYKFPDSEEYTYTAPVKRVKKRSAAKKPKKAIAGYIYFLREDGTEYYKCGKTTRLPHDRLTDLQTANPRTLHLLAYIYSSNIREVEQFCHSSLQNWHYRNEWYRMTEAEANSFINWLQRLDENWRIHAAKEKASISQ
jgi:hypothetical protein